MTMLFVLSSLCLAVWIPSGYAQTLNEAAILGATYVQLTIWDDGYADYNGVYIRSETATLCSTTGSFNTAYAGTYFYQKAGGTKYLFAVPDGLATEKLVMGDNATPQCIDINGINANSAVLVSTDDYIKTSDDNWGPEYYGTIAGGNSTFTVQADSSTTVKFKLCQSSYKSSGSWVVDANCATASPTTSPTEDPTMEPTMSPTDGPTAEPTKVPTSDPTMFFSTTMSYMESTEVTEPDQTDDEVCAFSQGDQGRALAFLEVETVCQFCACSDGGREACENVADALTDNTNFSDLEDLLEAKCPIASYEDLQDEDGQQCDLEDIKLKSDVTSCGCERLECDTGADAANEYKVATVFLTALLMWTWM